MSARLAVLGASGRMGRAVVRLGHEAGMTIVAAIGHSDVGRDAGELAGIGPVGVLVSTDLATLASSKADVVVDFSAPAALALAAPVLARAGIAIVSGTTGLDDAALRALTEAQASVPVMWEPNMSVGVHVLAELVRRATEALGLGYDVEIVEAHHRAKVDAPSGTALRLAESVRSARDGRLVHGREGRPGPRDAKEIGMHAVRGGDVIGDHTVTFFGDGERVELTHKASSRDLFARGAVRAAAWITGKPKGRYALGDMLGAAR